MGTYITRTFDIPPGKFSTCPLFPPLTSVLIFIICLCWKHPLLWKHSGIQYSFQSIFNKLEEKNNITKERK